MPLGRWLPPVETLRMALMDNLQMDLILLSLLFSLYSDPSPHLRASRHKTTSSLHSPYCPCTPCSCAVHQHGASLRERENIFDHVMNTLYMWPLAHMISDPRPSLFLRATLETGSGLGTRLLCTVYVDTYTMHIHGIGIA